MKIRLKEGCYGLIIWLMPAIHGATLSSSFGPGPAIRGRAFAGRKPC